MCVFIYIGQLHKVAKEIGTSLYLYCNKRIVIIDHKTHLFYQYIKFTQNLPRKNY